MRKNVTHEGAARYSLPEMTLDALHRVARTAVLCLALLPAACDQASAPPGAATRPAKRDDAAYAAALDAANAFCAAWRRRDYASGRARMTRRLAGQHPEQRIIDTLAGPRNPEHLAAEVFDGERVEPGRYAFRLKLFFRFIGQYPEQRIEVEDGRMEMLLGEDGVWRVDAFPIR